MTAEEANHALLQRREMTAAKAPAKQTQGDIESALDRLQVVPDGEAEKLRARAPENRSKIEELIRAARVPERHWTAGTLETSGPWAKVNASLGARSGTGFLIALTGKRGCGKTQLGIELIRERILAGRAALFSSATRFFMELKATYRKESTETEIGVLAAYGKPALLVLDEIGRRGETDWEDRLLFELLNDRYNAEKDTLLISNETKDGFVASVGPSLVDRINETGGIINCDWESYRGKK